jgi:uncharacterized protein YbbK (DUF523 family)
VRMSWSEGDSKSLAMSTRASKLKATPVPFEERLLLDTQAAAEMLSVCPKTLEKLPIPRVRLGTVKGVRWRKTDLEMFVRSLADA